MSREEFSKLAMFLKAAYEKDKFLASRESMEVWFAVLKDIPYEVAQAAALQHVRTCKFPPAPSEIIGQAVDVVQPAGEPWSWAWERVRDLIRKHGMWDEKSAFNEMDRMTETVVKRLGYKDLCMSENMMADRANFRTIYEQEQARQQSQARTPAGFRELLAGSAFKMLE